MQKSTYVHVFLSHLHSNQSMHNPCNCFSLLKFA